MTWKIGRRTTAHKDFDDWVAEGTDADYLYLIELIGENWQKRYGTHDPLVSLLVEHFDIGWDAAKKV